MGLTRADTAVLAAAVAGHLVMALLLVGPVGAVPATIAGSVVAVIVGLAANRLAAPTGTTLAPFGVGAGLAVGASLWVLAFLRMMDADPAPAVVAAALAPLAVTFALPSVRPLATLAVAAAPPAVAAPSHRRPTAPLDRRLDAPSDGRLAAVRHRYGDAIAWAGAVVIGVVALLATVPTAALDPGGEPWLAPSGDRGAAVAGMRYYLADDWHWPLLRTDDLGAAPDGTVIAHTDSLPILAVPVKLARSLLGSDLNYFPSWYLLAFTLQAVGAVALARSMGTRSRCAQLAAAALAVQLPMLVFRAGIHPSLAGQFVVLLTLAAAFRAGSGRSLGSRFLADRLAEDRLLQGRLVPDGASLATVAGLLAALAIHPYLFVMTAVPVAGVTVDRVARNRLGIGRAAVTGLLSLGLALLMLWAGGYLDVGAPAAADYGGHGLNLLGPVTPQLSGVLPGHEPILTTDGSAEAYSWSGAGIVILVVLAAAVGRRRLLAVADRWQATLAACGTLVLVAVSHRVAVGADRVLDLSSHLGPVLHRSGLLLVLTGLALMAALALAGLFPSLRPATVWFGGTVLVAGLALQRAGSLQEAMSPVRASGRLWWPVALLITVAAVASLARWAPRAALLPLLAVVVVLQTVDVGPVRDHSADNLSAAATVERVDALVLAMTGAEQVTVRPGADCAHQGDQAAITTAMAVAALAGPVPIDSVDAGPVPAAGPGRPDCGPGATAAPAPAAGDVLVLAGVHRSDPGRLLTHDQRCRDDGSMLVCAEAWSGLPADATGPFRPMVAEPRSFGAGGDGEMLLVDGWSQAEEWGLTVPVTGARMVVPLIGPVERDVVVQLRIRSTDDGPASLAVVEPDGTRHLVTAHSGSDEAHEVTVSAPAGRTLELELTSVGATPAGLSELTVLLG